MNAADVDVALGAAFVAQRLAELALAARNRRRLLARGAVEVGASHYPAMVALHAGWLAGCVLEGEYSGPLARVAPWIALAVVGQVLRYAAIAALGARWTTRVVVLPGAPPIRRGVFRLLRHPNYLGVALELFAVPMIVDAPWTATVATALNAILLRRVRIPCEERALASAAAGDAPAAMER
ncbi:MAG TPA: isoprenylcysteine carboxylmethyltransferase family protein [Planctomycetota bacterium]|nr:isoprenylcysteine carboxylmethyltransferase family protein [Planctomycetota bacterium]